MSEQQSHIENLLQDIARCNQELKRLETHPEEANRIVYPPGRFGMDNFEITYQNKVELERDEYVKWLGNHLEHYNLGLQSSKPPPIADDTRLKYLAFMDILGFSSIVQNNSHEELDYFISALVFDIQRGLAADENGQPRSRLYNDGYFGPDLSKATINSILLSDTIVFWTKDDSNESFYELVKTIQIFMHAEAYFLNVALRGTITVGELSYENVRITHPRLVVDQSTVYGSAIVEAHKFEIEQEWMGCIVTLKAINHFKRKKPPKSMIKSIFNNYIIQYPIPVKQPVLSSQEEYAIKWPITWESANGLVSIKNCFTKHQKLSDIPAIDAVLRKYTNTVKFADYVLNTSKKEA